MCRFIGQLPPRIFLVLLFDDFDTLELKLRGVNFRP